MAYAQIKTGYNADVDTGSETVWSAGGTYAFPSAAAATNIISGSTNDAAAGTGARTVAVTGVDASFNILTEVVTLNGTTQVVLANNYYRINNIEVLTAGSGGVNAGALDVRHTTTVIGQVPASAGVSQDGIFTAPAKGKMLEKVSCGSGGVDSARVKYTVEKRPAGGSWQTIGLLYTATEGRAQSELPMDLFLPAGMDLRVTATTDTDNSQASCSFKLK